MILVENNLCGNGNGHVILTSSISFADAVSTIIHIKELDPLLRERARTTRAELEASNEHVSRLEEENHRSRE